MTKNEKNISAQEASEKNGTRLQKKNGYKQRQKGSREKTRQGQKKTFSLSCGLLKKLCKH